MSDAPDPLLHQPTRLEIMAYLYRNRDAPVTRIREALHLTPGNLQSHGDKLAKAGYIQQRRVLAGIFEVHWRITAAGEHAFETYVDDMRRLIERIDPRR